MAAPPLQQGRVDPVAAVDNARAPLLLVPRAPPLPPPPPLLRHACGFVLRSSRLLLSSPHNPHTQGDVADASSSRLAAISSEAADSADVLTEAAAAPRPAVSQEQQQQQLQQRRADELPSTSGRSSRAAAATTPSAAAAAAGSRLEAAAGSLLSAVRAAVPEPRAPQSVAGVRPLPELDYGSLRGGQYPFLYDPVYGLPIVRDVVRYGELLRDIRQGEVKQILWFHEPGLDEPLAPSSRCLVRYKDGRVKQSVAPPDDARIPYAMEAHGVTVRRARGAGAAGNEAAGKGQGGSGGRALGRAPLGVARTVLPFKVEIAAVAAVPPAH